MRRGNRERCTPLTPVAAIALPSGALPLHDASLRSGEGSRPRTPSAARARGCTPRGQGTRRGILPHGSEAPRVPIPLCSVALITHPAALREVRSIPKGLICFN